MSFRILVTIGPRDSNWQKKNWSPGLGIGRRGHIVGLQVCGRGVEARALESEVRWQQQVICCKQIIVECLSFGGCRHWHGSRGQAAPHENDRSVSTSATFLPPSCAAS